jgi:succinate dehydrogenase hydrophobic anchor subunit
LYVINVTENVIRIVKNMFPQPIFLFFLFLQLLLVLIHVKKKKNYEAAMYCRC